jgi:dUTP pyrophosphatase
MSKIKLDICLLDKNCMPYKKYETDTGMDLKARIPKLISLSQFQTLKIPTGIAVQVPDGYALQVRPRSGLAVQGVVAEIGTIDNSYRGEINVILTNNSVQPLHINPYDRIAQLVVEKVYIPTINIVDTLEQTERGDNGFGSTGIGGS